MTDNDHSNPDRTERDSSQSRRGFLTKSAVAGGALLALGGGAGVAFADEHTVGGMDASFDDVEGTDIDVLNYALSLEHLEAAFYQAGLDAFDEEAFVDADALEEYSEADRQQLYSDVGTLADHEASHVSVLTQAIELLGGDPVVPAAYEFGFETVGEFLSTGAVLENTGVAAYAGAAPFVESPDLLAAALSIHSVEARHAAVMNSFTGTSPFPDAFDDASSQSDVLEAVSQFIVEVSETPTEEGSTETETETGNETATEAGNETATETGNETVTATETGNATATETGTETATGTDPSGT